MKGDVQRLNYCTHAIDDMLLTAREFHQMGMSISSEVMYRLAELVQLSVKFILPNCCELIDPKQFEQKHLDLLKLPFSVIALEIPWVFDDNIDVLGGIEKDPATKRIALCWEANEEYELIPGINNVLNAFPGNGAFVLPIFWGAKYAKWHVGAGATFVPYENTIKNAGGDGELPASKIAFQALADAGSIFSDPKEFKAEPIVILPELFHQMSKDFGGEQKALAHIMLDSQDEVTSLIQTCSVLNCSNVCAVDLPPPKASNKKREAKGKQPFFTYKVLQVPDNGSGDATPRGGSHASPRMYLRRGHLRHLSKTNRTVWVKPTVVNPGSKMGVVMKDYKPSA